MSQRPEIVSHTSLRGVAAAMVVFLHYKSLLVPQLDPVHLTAFFEKGNLWVDFFFMLSGFVMSYVYGLTSTVRADAAVLGRYGLARVARIYPLHLISLVAVFFFFLLLGAVSWLRGSDFCCLLEPPYRTPESLLANALLVHAWGTIDVPTWNIPSWSLSAEFACYVVFGFLLWLGSKARLIAIAALTALTLIYYTTGWIQGIDVDGNFRLSGLRAVSAFTLGMLVFMAAPRLGRLSLAVTNTLQLLSLATLSLSLHVDANDFVVLAQMPLLLALTANDKGWLATVLKQPLLHWLGLLSYSIYMWHYPLRLVALKLSAKFEQAWALDTAAGSIIFVLAMTAICLLVSHLSFHRVETPLRRLIGSWGHRSNRVNA